ncbi:hypothetical protein KCP73_01100 [Salmonella enterica subsp. enterica]|nr:hypothetical protein KCP73_01100 [Salmonella enterica subsp. enterica]
MCLNPPDLHHLSESAGALSRKLTLLLKAQLLPTPCTMEGVQGSCASMKDTLASLLFIPYTGVT